MGLREMLGFGSSGGYSAYNTGAVNTPAQGALALNAPAKTDSGFFIRTDDASRAASDFSSQSVMPSEALAAYRSDDVAKFRKLAADGRIKAHVWTTLVNAAFPSPGGVKIYEPDNGDDSSHSAIANEAAGEVILQTYSPDTFTTEDEYVPALEILRKPYIPLKNGAKYIPSKLDLSSIRLEFNPGTLTINATTLVRTWTGAKVRVLLKILPGVAYATNDGADTAGWLKSNFRIVSVPEA